MRRTTTVKRGANSRRGQLGKLLVGSPTALELIEQPLSARCRCLHPPCTSVLSSGAGELSVIDVIASDTTTLMTRSTSGATGDGYGRQALEFGVFEGTIPEGEYETGKIRVWDSGIYAPSNG